MCACGTWVMIVARKKGRTMAWTDDKSTVIIIRLMMLFLTRKAGARPIIWRSTADSFSAPSNQVGIKISER